MISVYKFEHCFVSKVDARALTEVNSLLYGRKAKYSFRYINYYRDKLIMVPIPKNIEVIPDSEAPHIGTIDMRPFLNTVTDFTFEDKIYLHSDCTIPRAKVTQKYTRVLRPKKADICVVPELNKEERSVENVAIFINKDKCKIYIIENITDWKNGKCVYYTSEKCKDFPLGSCILDINPNLKDTSIDEKSYYDNPQQMFRMDNWKDFLASTLLYYGPVLSLYPKESWMIDALYNKLHNIITEDRLFATLGDSTNEFTKEVYDNLREMLISPDKTIVGLGLKTIAEMDYEKYRNTTIHLLTNNKGNWTRNDMRSNTSVKYMLNYLGLCGGKRESYANTATQEDFTLMQEVIKRDINEKVEAIKKAFNSRFPFANLDLSYEFEISPKLDGEEVPSDGDIEDYDV